MAFPFLYSLADGTENVIYKEIEEVLGNIGFAPEIYSPYSVSALLSNLLGTGPFESSTLDDIVLFTEDGIVEVSYNSGIVSTSVQQIYFDSFSDIIYDFDVGKVRNGVTDHHDIAVAAHGFFFVILNAGGGF